MNIIQMNIIQINIISHTYIKFKMYIPITIDFIYYIINAITIK